MKRICKSLFKVLLVVMLFTSTSVVLSTAGFKTVSEARAAVTSEDVIKYLTELGYTVIDMSPIEGTENWMGHTYINGKYYITTVHCEGDNIIDHEDSSL